MFFKKIFTLFFLLSFSCPVFAGFIENSTCLKEMKAYYPHLKTGKLHWEKQDKFFRCVHDFLELIVVSKIFTHDSSRDYFTKAEIFKMFNVHFKLKKEFAEGLVDNLFLIKHIFIGGELNQLSDDGIKKIYNLVNIYKDFYYIIHKRIGTIQKILEPKRRGEVSEEDFQFTLSKIQEGLRFLKISYKNKGVRYRVSDFDHLFTYLGKYSEDVSSWEKYSSFLTLWVQGLLSPRTHIEGKSWGAFFNSSHQMISMFLFYKKYIVLNDFSRPEMLPRVLKSLEYFVSALSFTEPIKEKQGFPITNIDKMLSIMIFSSKDQVQLSDQFRIFTNKKANPISLFTRSLACFAFKTKQTKDCSYKVEQKNSLSLEYTFPDGVFQFYKDQQKWLPKQGLAFEATPSQLKSVKNWLASYVEGYNQLYQRHTEKVSKFYNFDHWLDPFFGETEGDSRVIFYPTSGFLQYKLPSRLLNYRFLSNLFLSSYNKDEEGYKLSAKNWKSVVDEVMPVLLAFESVGYDSSLRDQFLGFFDYSDNFLNSSNGDNFLDEKEILDLVVHVMSAVENSKYAYNKLITTCSNSLQASCVASKLFEKDIIQVFPRLQHYLSGRNSKGYQLSTEELLKDRSPLVSSSDLIDVFLLMQMLEVQFQLVDKNKNIRLESQEISQVVKKMSKQIAYSIPYIKNISQSQSFIMYSLKTGRIPFLQEEGENFHSLRFFDWHTNHRDESFNVSKEELYSTTLKFYKLYRDQLR